MADGDPSGAHPPVVFYGLWPKFAEPAGDGTAVGDAHREPVMRVVSWPGAFEPEAQRGA